MSDYLTAALERNAAALEKARAIRQARPKHRVTVPTIGEVGTKWSAHEHETVARMIAEGCSYAEISRALDRHPDTISRYCSQKGIQPGKRAHRKITEPDEVIIQEYLGGASTIQIANKYGMTDGVVTYVLKRNNIPRRSQSDAERLRRMRARAQAVAAATAEGKRLAARIFQLDYETQNELHALLIRATKLAGGGV